MKQYLLDTNVCIFFMKEMYGVADKIDEAGFDNCFISDVTLAELYYGASKSTKKKVMFEGVKKLERLFTPIPIKPALETFGEAKADLVRQGRMIDDFDLLIGSTAVANNLTMVTENVKHLSRIKGIEIENWVDRSK